MAYQPIQMPRPAVASAADSLGEALDELGRVRRQNAQDKRQAGLDADAKKRQGQLDFQQALQLAASLKAKGDLPGAAAVMSPFQADLHDQPLPGMTPPLAGGSPLPDTMEFGGKRPGQPAGPPARETQSPPETGPIDPSFVDSLPMGAPGPAQPPPQQPPPNPIMAARQAQEAGNQQRAHQVLSFMAPGGQKITWDPEQEQAQARERDRQAMHENVDVLDQAFAPLLGKDAIVTKYYPQVRAAYGASSGPIDPKAVMSEMRAMAIEDARAGREQDRLDSVEKNNQANRDLRRDLETQQEKAGKYSGRHRAGAGGGGTGGAGGTAYDLKTEKQNETELAHIEAEKNKYLRGSGLDKDIAAHNEFARALHELDNSPSPASQIGVLDKFIRANTGRGAVIGTIKMQLQHMGGLDASLEGWLEGKTTGALGATQVKNLRDAIAASKNATDEEIKNKHQAFVDTHFSGADYNTKGNWERAHQDLFGQVRDEAGKELYPTEYDPNAPTVVRGSGKRSVATVGVNARAGASNPIMDARAVSKLPPADQEAVKWALDPANAGNPKATAILKLHNMAH
jgi:hypothetical protein